MGNELKPSVSAEFWAGKRVFLTGHTGFKGGWLSLWLQTLGAEVFGYSLEPPTTPNLYSLANVGANMHCTIADIRDMSALRTAINNARPDVVLHLAAQPLVLESYANPLETLDTNILGTANLLQCVRALTSVKSVVVVTSDKCYQNNEWDWAYREDEPMGGSDPYSVSKGCAELVTASFRQSFFADHPASIATARAGNVIGGGDFAKDRLLTDIMFAIRNGKPVQIRNPNATRPWQHVLEPLGGYLLLAQFLAQRGSEFAEGWNFGPAEEDARPVSWICDQLVDRWGDGACWETDSRVHPHEATYLKVDSSKSKRRLGWQPKLRLAEALDWIVSWNRDYENGNDLAQATRHQIQKFQAST